MISIIRLFLLVTPFMAAAGVSALATIGDGEPESDQRELMYMDDYYGGGYDDYYGSGGGGGMDDYYVDDYYMHGHHGHHETAAPKKQGPLVSLNINQANINNNAPTDPPTPPPTDPPVTAAPALDDDYMFGMGDDDLFNPYPADDDDDDDFDVTAPQDDDANGDDYLDVVLDALDTIEVSARRKLRGTTAAKKNTNGSSGSKPETN